MSAGACTPGDGSCATCPFAGMSRPEKLRAVEAGGVEMLCHESQSLDGDLPDRRCRGFHGGEFPMPILRPINDGYTLDGATTPQGVWPKIAFRFRVPTQRESIEYYTADKSTPEKFAEAINKLLVKKLVSWDVAEAAPEGSERLVPIDEAGIRRFLPEHLAAEILNVILDAGRSQEAAEKNSRSESGSS